MIGRRGLLAAVAVSAVLGVAACGSKETATVYDAAGFKERIQPSTVVLDVRTPEEFAEGHLDGALNIDVSGDFAAGIAGLDKGAEYALYCRSGNRSATALKIMQDAGFTKVFHLDGGIGAWQAAGYPVVS